MSATPHLHEAWWLIEATAPPRPLYYTGPCRHPTAYRTIAGTTEDATKAARYPTEEAAKLTIALILSIDTTEPTWPLRVANSGWKVAEHIFDYTARTAEPSMREETVYEKSARWNWPDGRPDL